MNVPARDHKRTFNIFIQFIIRLINGKKMLNVKSLKSHDIRYLYHPIPRHCIPN